MLPAEVEVTHFYGILITLIFVCKRVSLTQEKNNFGKRLKTTFGKPDPDSHEGMPIRNLGF
jgi:hypothetical protein